MGFENPEEDVRTALDGEGFETDQIDLENTSSDVKAVKAPRRSSRRDMKQGLIPGAKRDRLGRVAPNENETGDDGDMIAPVRPVRLSGGGNAHIQKPMMNEGSEFAYLFTKDEDSDDSSAHMNRERASWLDGLAFDGKSDGDSSQYDDLFSRSPSMVHGKTERVYDESLIESEPERKAPAPAPKPADEPRPAPAPASPQPTVQEKNDGGRKSFFNRRAKNEKNDAASGQPTAADIVKQADAAAMQYDNRSSRDMRYDDRRDYDRRDYDRRDYDRSDYDRRDYDRRDYDRRDYDRRDYDRRDYDRRDYDRRYYDSRDYDRDRHGDTYSQYGGAPGYPPQYVPQYYPAYPPQPTYVVPPYQGYPVQGIPVQGVPVQGVPIQGIPYPMPYQQVGYNYVYVQPEQQNKTAENPAQPVTLPDTPAEILTAAAVAALNEHAPETTDASAAAQTEEVTQTDYSALISGKPEPEPDREQNMPEIPDHIPSAPRFNRRSRQDEAVQTEAAPVYPTLTDIPADNEAESPDSASSSRFNRRSRSSGDSSATAPYSDTEPNFSGDEPAPRFNRRSRSSDSASETLAAPDSIPSDIPSAPRFRKRSGN